MTCHNLKFTACLIALLILSSCATGENGETAGSTLAEAAPLTTASPAMTLPETTSSMMDAPETISAEAGNNPHAALSLNVTDLKFSSPEKNAIFVGMSRKDFEIATGESIDNNWYYTVEDGSVTAASMSDTIILLNFTGNFNYSLDGCISKESTMDDITKIFGEPDRTSDKIPPSNPMQYLAYYDLDDSGMLIFTMNTDDKIMSIQAGNTTDDFSSIEGAVYEQISGTGDMVYESIRGNVGCLEITYTGDSGIRITVVDDGGIEHILVDSQSDHSGRIMIPDFYPYGMNIEGDGNWTIKSLLPNTQTPIEKNSSFSGKGDFVTSVFNLWDSNVPPKSRRWKMMNDGNGVFKVILHTGDFFRSQVETLVSTAGAFEGDIIFDLPSDQSGIGFFEIISDGNWRIEPA